MLLGPGERGQGLGALEPHCSGVPASAAWPNGQLSFSHRLLPWWELQAKQCQLLALPHPQSGNREVPQ